MNLDLDTTCIGYFSLGERFDSRSKVIRGPGYIISIMEGVVAGLHVTFSAKGGSELLFDEYVVEKGVEHKFNSKTTPEDIAEIFGEPAEQWTDDYAQNYRYSRDNIELEFNWFVDGGFEYLAVDLND